MNQPPISDHSGVDPALPLHVRVVHASPGRIRLKLRQADFDSSLLLRAERALSALPGVLTVRRNPLTRGVVVSYDYRALDTSDLFSAVNSAGVPLVPEVDNGVTQGAIRPFDQTISGVFTRMDQRVSGRTRGRFDLRTLVPLGLAALGVRELLSGRLTAAPWYVLLWYSFDSFQKLRKPGEPTHQPRG